MGLFDNLSGAMKGALGQAETGLLPGLLAQVLAKTDIESTAGLLSRLQQGGLGNEVTSWLSKGANLPISPEQLHSAIGSEQLHQIAEASGLPIEKVLALLSQQLPQTIDTMSPNGALEESGSLQDQAGIRDIST